MSSPADTPERFPNIRPSDAGTLIVIRRDRNGAKLLMGRRSDAHVFMPGALVFPGGKVDRADRHAPSLDELDPTVAAKLLVRAPGKTPARARAIALAAIRETAEETGLLIGREGFSPRPAAGGWGMFAGAGLLPTLAPLRFVARAVTPPGLVRRFDARFFAVFADAVGGAVNVPETEMMNPVWLSLDEARAERLPRITRAVLDGLDARLARDPRLEAPGPIPFHRRRNPADEGIAEEL